jgi:hypothetical protein
MHEAERPIKSNVKNEIAAGGNRSGSGARSRKVASGRAHLPLNWNPWRAASHLFQVREVLHM